MDIQIAWYFDLRGIDCYRFINDKTISIFIQKLETIVYSIFNMIFSITEIHQKRIRFAYRISQSLKNFSMFKFPFSQNIQQMISDVKLSLEKITTFTERNDNYNLSNKKDVPKSYKDYFEELKTILFEISNDFDWETPVICSPSKNSPLLIKKLTSRNPKKVITVQNLCFFIKFLPDSIISSSQTILKDLAASKLYLNLKSALSTKFINIILAPLTISAFYTDLHTKNLQNEAFCINQHSNICSIYWDFLLAILTNKDGLSNGFFFLKSLILAKNELMNFPFIKSDKMVLIELHDSKSISDELISYNMNLFGLKGDANFISDFNVPFQTLSFNQCFCTAYLCSFSKGSLFLKINAQEKPTFVGSNNIVTFMSKSLKINQQDYSLMDNNFFVITYFYGFNYLSLTISLIEIKSLNISSPKPKTKDHLSYIMPSNKIFFDTLSKYMHGQSSKVNGKVLNDSKMESDCYFKYLKVVMKSCMDINSNIINHNATTTINSSSLDVVSNSSICQSSECNQSTQRLARIYSNSDVIKNPHILNDLNDDQSLDGLKVSFEVFECMDCEELKNTISSFENSDNEYIVKIQDSTVSTRQYIYLKLLLFEKLSTKDEDLIANKRFVDQTIKLLRELLFFNDQTVVNLFIEQFLLRRFIQNYPKFLIVIHEKLLLPLPSSLSLKPFSLNSEPSDDFEDNDENFNNNSSNHAFKLNDKLDESGSQRFNTKITLKRCSSINESTLNKKRRISLSTVRSSVSNNFNTTDHSNSFTMNKHSDSIKRSISSKNILKSVRRSLFDESSGNSSQNSITQLIETNNSLKPHSILNANKLNSSIIKSPTFKPNKSPNRFYRSKTVVSLDIMNESKNSIQIMDDFKTSDLTKPVDLSIQQTNRSNLLSAILMSTPEKITLQLDYSINSPFKTPKTPVLSPKAKNIFFASPNNGIDWTMTPWKYYRQNDESHTNNMPKTPSKLYNNNQISSSNQISKSTSSSNNQNSDELTHHLTPVKVKDQTFRQTPIRSIRLFQSPFKQITEHNNNNNIIMIDNVNIEQSSLNYAQNTLVTSTIQPLDIGSKDCLPLCSKKLHFDELVTAHKSNDHIFVKSPSILNKNLCSSPSISLLFKCPLIQSSPSTENPP